MKKADNSATGDSPSQLIDARIKELGDWRGETLARMRKLIKQKFPTSSKSGSGGACLSGTATG